jgi:hypothetical protein
MGDMQNRPWQNVVAVLTSAVMIILTAMLVWTSLFT